MTGLFDGIFGTATTITVQEFLICIAVSLVIGVFLAGVYAFRSKYTQSFLVTLALIPAVVCVVIMMVNGNVGAGVAVAGAFSLVRFRSVPGSAKEICAIFLAMGAGLVTGMGFIGYAILFAIILGGAMFICSLTGFGGVRDEERALKITVPENLDYTEAFDEILADCTDSYRLTNVKTTNMGSLFKLTYVVKLKKDTNQKDMIDRLRVRNGNLEIMLTQMDSGDMTL